MKITNIAKKIWNSKTFEAVVDTTFEVAEAFNEAIIETFNNIASSPEKIDYFTETYEYWSSLCPVDREYYFSHNEVLQRYGELYYYNDKEQCAKSIATIAEKERRVFVNKYDRY